MKAKPVLLIILYFLLWVALPFTHPGGNLLKSGRETNDFEETLKGNFDQYPHCHHLLKCGENSGQSFLSLDETDPASFWANLFLPISAIGKFADRLGFGNHALHFTSFPRAAAFAGIRIIFPFHYFW